MKPNVTLPTIQQWMQSVIEHPGTNDEAWHSPEAERSLPYDEALKNVLPSATLTPVERIAIYRRMFFLRMTESMAIDYPAVKQILGEERFDRLIAEDYVRLYPSRSYTLNHLGKYFPEFLRNSALPQKEFLADLAALELAVTENLEAEESPLLMQQEIASVPPEQWETAVLKPVRALQLMEFRYNVCAVLDAVNNETNIPEILESPAFAVVYRNAYRSYWEEIPEPQYVLLSALLSGTPFGRSIERLAERFPENDEQLRRQLFDWFGTWVRNGFFSGIILQR